MLREFGVKGVMVQEVVSLDEEMMAFLKYRFRFSPCEDTRILLISYQ